MADNHLVWFKNMYSREWALCQTDRRLQLIQKITGDWNFRHIKLLFPKITMEVHALFFL